MAFAGDHEVVVAVEPQFDRRFELVRGHRGPHCHMAGLRFFAAKATAHAPAFHPHRVVAQAQRMRHPVLHLARVLGAAVDRPLALGMGHRVGHLTLQIKVFLTADFQRALQYMRCLGHAFLQVTPADMHGW